VHKWENNIKIDIEDTEFEDVNRIYLSQKWVKWVHFVKTVIDLLVP
jgi:hypothetical protein